MIVLVTVVLVVVFAHPSLERLNLLAVGKHAIRRIRFVKHGRQRDAWCRR